jgi:plastocyanin
MRHRLANHTTAAIALALAVVGVTGVFHTVPAWGAATQVEIDQFTFAPQQVTVKAGTTVTWTNDDDVPHTVASSIKLFKSKALDTKDRFSFTFTTPGTYEYFCSLHPHMTGVVVVEGGSAAQ